jgi:peroxiredoxin
MTLNRFILILFAALVLITGCEKSNQFTINGRITHAEDETIYLEKLLVTSRELVAETKIDKNGEFTFKGEASIPTFYVLRLENNRLITLLLDSLENVTIEADIANFDLEYNVEGSHGSVLIKELTEKLNETEHKLDSLRALNTLYQGNPDHEKLKPQWDEEFNKIMQEQIKFSSDFVLENAFSMASVYALYQKFKDNSYVIRDLQTMRTAASALNSIYPNSRHVQALYRNTLDILNNERAAKVKQFIQEQGDNSPDIVLPDQDGNEVALSSLRGKIVLVHFWSAEDRGSRIVNPVLVEAYKKYKRKGFEIYQVSVDQNRIEWVDAIDTDMLTWINVGDMKGSMAAANVYNIKQIPFNYLLDKEGVIIAKNLQGPALDKALNRILN